LDGKHVVFGRVSGGKDTVDLIEAEGGGGGRTKRPVLIADCGETKTKKT
jgi:peptidylprolyl isomerase